MNNDANCNEIPIPDYETLGSISASSTQSRRNWRVLFGGFLLSGLIVAAMLPDPLERETRNLPPGQIEDQMARGMRWWGRQMARWQIDLPAIRLRGKIEEISQIDWLTVYCAVRSYGILSESNFLSRIPTQSGEARFECE